MIKTVSAQYIKRFGPCSQGIETFIRAHGDKSVTWLEAYSSNDISDIAWLISQVCRTDEDARKDVDKLYTDALQYVTEEDSEFLERTISDEDYQLRLSTIAALRYKPEVRKLFTEMLRRWSK